MYSAAGKSSYSITADDISNKFATVSLLWSKGQTYGGKDNYVMNWSIEDSSGLAPGFNYIQGDMHAITESGFEAIVFLINDAPDAYHVGDTFIVHAVAFGL